MFKLLKKLLTIFLNLRIYFKNPSQCDFVIYDRTIGKALKSYLDLNKFFILETRKESLYLFLFFKSLFKNKSNWNYKSYINEVILKVRPKIIITNIDNNKNFWSLKKKFINIQTVFVQNGFRNNQDNDIFGELNKNDEKSYLVDKMFVFNDEIGKKYSNYITGDIIPIGSLNNNRVVIKKEKSQGILFISEWGPNRKWKNRSVESKNNFFYPEKYLFSLLVDFANRNKIKLNVLGRPEKIGYPGDKKEEFNFFYEIAGNKNWNYLNTLGSGDESYNLIDSSNLVVTISSTLGYESLARGKKTVFFSCRGLKMKNSNSYKFAWPSDLPDNGPFWSNADDPKDFYRIMNNLIQIKQEEWLKVVEPYLSKCMNYDYGNSKFLKEMENLKVPTKNN